MDKNEALSMSRSASFRKIKIRAQTPTSLNQKRQLRESPAMDAANPQRWYDKALNLIFLQ